MRTEWVAWLLLAGMLGCGGKESVERERERARRAEFRIAAACTQAATMIPLTLGELNRDPEIGFALATRDVGNVQLCGGDARALGDAILRGDMAATRQGLVELLALWCPNCSLPNVKP
jgi:hypothetical protein